MGFRFRKSINLGGGVRINLSKSGVGYSVGTKGLRVTKTADGKTRTTASIPGTGISHVSETGKKKSTTAKTGKPVVKATIGTNEEEALKQYYAEKERKTQGKSVEQKKPQTKQPIQNRTSVSSKPVIEKKPAVDSKKAQTVSDGSLLMSKYGLLNDCIIKLYPDKIVFGKNGKMTTVPISKIKRVRQELTNLNIAYEGGPWGGKPFSIGSISEIKNWVNTLNKMIKK